MTKETRKGDCRSGHNIIWEKTLYKKIVFKCKKCGKLFVFYSGYMGIKIMKTQKEIEGVVPYSGATYDEGFERYKSKLKNLGIKNIDKAVDDLFDHIGYIGRLLFWYWHFKELERKLKGAEK